MRLPRAHPAELHAHPRGLRPPHDSLDLGLSAQPGQAQEQAHRRAVGQRVRGLYEHPAQAHVPAAGLDAGARMDLRDDLLKSTPLGWACRWGREELVRLLLDRGADPVEADAEPWARPKAWAEKMGHGAVLVALQNIG